MSHAWVSVLLLGLLFSLRLWLTSSTGSKLQKPGRIFQWTSSQPG
jgi:hypothetical protein